MTNQPKTKTICDNCEIEIKLTNDVLTNGCPKCNSFKFRSIRLFSEEEEKEQEMMMIVEKELSEDDITEGIEAIRLLPNGSFEVNIEQLIQDVEDEKPIINRNKDGSYFIKFKTDKKKK